MIPELDQHMAEADNPTPLTSRFSPWHACGLSYRKYSDGMRQSEHLSLEGCILQLEPGDVEHEAAARQWEEIFGIAKSRDLLAFTNARLGFIPGKEGQAGGLVSITVGVGDKLELDGILQRAREVGLYEDHQIKMCGILWYFVLTGYSKSVAKL